MHDCVIVKSSDLIDFSCWFNFSLIVEYESEVGDQSLALEFSDSSKIKYP